MVNPTESAAVSVRCSNHHEILTGGLWNFLTRKHRVDLFLQWSGRLFETHELILEVFLPPEKLASNNVDLHNLAYLLEFLYRGQVSVPRKELDRLTQLAEQLELKVLLDAIHLAKNADSPLEHLSTGRQPNGHQTDVFDGERTEVIYPISEGHATGLAESSSDDDHCVDDAAAKSDPEIESLEVVASTNETTESLHEARPVLASPEILTSAEEAIDTPATVERASNSARQRGRPPKRRWVDRKFVQDLVACADAEMPVNRPETVDKDNSTFTVTFRSGSERSTKKRRYLKFSNCNECHHAFQTAEARDSHVCSRTFSTPLIYDCHHCNYTSERVARFLAHLTKHDPNVTVVRCTVCGVPLCDAESLNRHMKTHDAVRQCPICNYRSVCSKNYSVHMYQKHQRLTNNEPVKPKPNGKIAVRPQPSNSASAARARFTFFNCKPCHRAFQTAEARDSHVCSRIFSSCRMFDCHHCSFTTERVARFLVHMAKHDPNVSFVRCTVCGVPLCGAASLKRHMKTHNVERQCPMCDYRTVARRKYNLHMYQTHGRFANNEPMKSKAGAGSAAIPRPGRDGSGPKEVTVFGCAVCNCAFRTEEARDSHKCSMIKSAHRIYRCHHCHVEYFLVSAFLTHLATHDHLECEICGKPVRGAPSLERHKATHGTRSCTRCNFVANSPCDLRHHLQIGHNVNSEDASAELAVDPPSASGQQCLRIERDSDASIIMQSETGAPGTSAVVSPVPASLVVAEFCIEGTLESLSEAPIDLGMMPTLGSSVLPSSGDFQVSVNPEVDAESPSTAEMCESLNQVIEGFESSGSHRLPHDDVDVEEEPSNGRHTDDNNRRQKCGRRRLPTAVDPLAAVAASERPKVFTCKPCNRAYQTKEARDAHPCSTTRRDTKTFACHHCGFECQRVAFFFAHLTTHDASVTVLRCSICRQPMTSLASLQRHMLVHRIYECPRCLFTTVDNKTYRLHLLNQHRLNSKLQPVAAKFNCDRCGFRTDLVNSWETHRARHETLDASPHKCKDCGAAFLNATTLASHPCHSKPHRKRFNCERCKFRSDCEDRYLKHVTKQHNCDVTVFRCNYCAQSFARAELMELHKRTEHTVHVCLHCKFETDDAETFRQHTETFHEIADSGSFARVDETAVARRFEENVPATKRDINDSFMFCTDCNRAFLGEVSLAGHSCSRVSGRHCIFVCPHCTYETERKSRFLVHFAKRHDSSVAAYRCGICRVPYSNAEALEVHERTHKVYSCQQCTFETPTYITFYKHRRAHKEEENDGCAPVPKNGVRRRRIFCK